MTTTQLLDIQTQDLNTYEFQPKYMVDLQQNLFGFLLDSDTSLSEKNAVVQPLNQEAKKFCLYCGAKLIRKDKREYVWNLKKFCCRYHKNLYKNKKLWEHTPLRKQQKKIRFHSYIYHRKLLGDQCELCGSTSNLEIHHNNYTDKSIKNCRLICRECHRKKIHNLPMEPFSILSTPNDFNRIAP